jgi:hypothetical protein
MADALFSSLYDLDEYENSAEKIDLDELFDKRRTYVQKEVETYKKILMRIHNKIKITSRQRINNDFTTFIVPEFIVGLPRFDTLGCIGYCIEKLKENGFLVRYTHPNMLFITWRHYVPSYEREMIKKRTGVRVDERGNIVGGAGGAGGAGGIGSRGGGGYGMEDMGGVRFGDSSRASSGSGSGRLKLLEDTASLEERDLMMFSRRDREREPSRGQQLGSGGRGGGGGGTYGDTRQQRQYRDISTYSPTGVYNRDIIP